MRRRHNFWAEAGHGRAESAAVRYRPKSAVVLVRGFARLAPTLKSLNPHAGSAHGAGHRRARESECPIQGLRLVVTTHPTP